ncbi:tyrosine-type recombinase/integrase [Paenibacillus chitinolyticus]|uniref:tyrosine-type recombinase/integrase n=1 Tax=Paenibacillus chitinolyticus TaxID=79263 RepID=UPI003557F50C
MNKATYNVVSLQHDSAYEDIQAFLSKHGIQSASTAQNYERGIRKFFMYMKNKNIEDLKREDLQFRNVDMIRYQKYLIDHYNKKTTVNAYIAAVLSLFEHLERNEYPIKSSMLRLDFLPVDSQSYGKLTLEEARLFAELALSQDKGLEKSVLIRLAYTTSIREGALLSLTEDNIHPSECGEYYIVEVIDKGGIKDKKPIRPDLYNALMDLRQQHYCKRYKDKKFFHITPKTISAMMKKIRIQLGIPDRRNIVFHSFKTVAINWELETTGDIHRAKRQGNHKNVNTTMIYANNEIGMENMAGIQMDNDIKEDIFEKLSREEMISLLKGIKNGLGYQVRSAAQKIISNRT